jgi:hypothetical protein
MDLKMSHKETREILFQLKVGTVDISPQEKHRSQPETDGGDGDERPASISQDIAPGNNQKRRHNLPCSKLYNSFPIYYKISAICLFSMNSSLIISPVKIAS